MDSLIEIIWNKESQLTVDWVGWLLLFLDFRYFKKSFTSS